MESFEIDTLDFVIHYCLLYFKIAILGFLTTKNGLFNLFFLTLFKIVGQENLDFASLLWFLFYSQISLDFGFYCYKILILLFICHKKYANLTNDRTCHWSGLTLCQSLSLRHRLCKPQNKPRRQVLFFSHFIVEDSKAQKAQDTLPKKEKELDYPLNLRSAHLSAH